MATIATTAQNHHRNYHRQNYSHHHPSFSSSLLEEIYRSIDNNDETSKTRRSSSGTSYLQRDNSLCFINVDRWVENGKYRRRPVDYFSSSDSSSGAESLSGYAKKKPPVLRPIITTDFHRKSCSDESPAKKSKKEGNLQKRALKLYGDLKKVKQPISPGGKLATFLNSIFNASKKPKIGSLSSISVVTPSSTAASRSCLSKTPSSAGRLERRSVRFADDDVARRDSMANDEEFKFQIREKQRRVEEVAKELLKNYHNNYKKELNLNVNINDVSNERRKFDNFNDDDDVSCCSSELFELENLLDNRYREELPVYETTHVATNRAIANGFIL